MQNQIIVMQKLHEGIYKSEGGGVPCLLKTYPPTGRGLLLAARYARKKAKQAVLSYGNVGSGSTWVELNNKDLEWNFWLTDPSQEDKWMLNVADDAVKKLLV